MIRITLLVLFILALKPQAIAQNDSIYIWPGKVPHSSKPKAAPVPIILDDGSIRVVEVTNPLLAVFEPDPTKRNGKAALVCPGGGYVRLAVHKEGYATADWLTSLGFTVFVLHYTVPGQRDGALQDIQRSLRLIRHLSNQYQIDTANITAVGFSAGAHLVARASMKEGLPSYPVQDAADNLSPRPNQMMLIYPAYLNDLQSGELISELKASQTTVRTFIFQTMDDTYAVSALAIASALQKAGADAELHLLPKGGHGYGMTSGIVAAEAWPKLAETWLNRQNEEK